MARPNTLSEVARRIAAGIDQSVAIPEFLDVFYRTGTAPDQMTMVRDEPAPSGDQKLDALLAAICHYLTKQHDLRPMPGWVSRPIRVLAEPWFTTSIDDDGMREYLAFSSPSEFRYHNIFTEAVPLRRAAQSNRATGGR